MGLVKQNNSIGLWVSCYRMMLNSISCIIEEPFTKVALKEEEQSKISREEFLSQKTISKCNRKKNFKTKIYLIKNKNIHFGFQVFHSIRYFPLRAWILKLMNL